jgi:hypothetical protein
MANPYRAEVLQKLAEVQDKAGQGEAAKATRALVPASRWIAIAAQLSQDTRTYDPAMALKSVAARPDMPDQVDEGTKLVRLTADVGEAMGWGLHRIRNLENKR